MQHLRLSSLLNDFMHCYRRVDADIMKLYISDMDHGRKLICSSYVLEHVGMLILSSFFLIACVNTIYKYCCDWIICDL